MDIGETRREVAGLIRSLEQEYGITVSAGVNLELLKADEALRRADIAKLELPARLDKGRP